MRRDGLEQLGGKTLGEEVQGLRGYVERGVGEARLVLLGRRRVVPVVFSEEGDVAVIGTTALEVFGLGVDVVRGVLKEAELLLLTLVDMRCSNLQIEHY